ncbi:Protein of unknown function [Gryllus bimaculatus]|nr:Protein of unknown function [Gryllus bimaculatus]
MSHIAVVTTGCGVFRGDGAGTHGAHGHSLTQKTFFGGRGRRVRRRGDRRRATGHGEGRGPRVRRRQGDGRGRDDGRRRGRRATGRRGDGHAWGAAGARARCDGATGDGDGQPGATCDGRDGATRHGATGRTGARRRSDGATGQRGGGARTCDSGRRRAAVASRADVNVSLWGSHATSDLFSAARWRDRSAAVCPPPFGRDSSRRHVPPVPLAHIPRLEGSYARLLLRSTPNEPEASKRPQFPQLIGSHSLLASTDRLMWPAGSVAVVIGPMSLPEKLGMYYFFCFHRLRW